MANRSSGNRAPDGKLAFYVTSHGFGHLNRTVAVINKVPADVSRRHPVAPQPLSPLARAADPPGRADGSCLGRRRGQSAGRQHGDRRPGNPGAGPARSRRGRDAGGRRGSAGCATRMSRPCSATLLRSRWWRPACAGIPGFLRGQLHLGRHLRPLRPRRGEGRNPLRRRAAPGLSPGDDRLPGRAGPPHGLAAGATQRRHGRQSGPRPPQGTAPTCWG